MAYLSRREFFKKAGVGLGTLTLINLGVGKLLHSQQGQTIRVAIGIDPDTLDPIKQTTTLIQMMVDHLMETPLFLTPEVELQPLLATSWSISPDSKEITLNLRQGVEFHDGTPFNAEALKFSLDRTFVESCPLCGMSLGTLERVDVVNEFTAKLIYSKPFAPALIGLTSFPQAAAISPTAFQALGAEKFGRQPVGTGPFRFEDWTPGEKVVMVKNEDYWGKPAIPQRLEWVIAPEAGTRSAMVLAGDVDIAYQPPAPDIPRLQASPNVDALLVPSTRIMFVGLNTTKPPLDNKKVRQALNHAIDKKAIVERVLLGAGVPNDAPLPSSFFGYNKIGFYEYDPDKARRLLAEAGYPNGLDRTLLFLHPTGRYILDAQVAQVIQAQLAEVGVQVELRTMDWPTYVGTLLKPREESIHDMAFLGWGPLPDAHHTLYSMFHSSQQPPTSFNISFYGNPQVDQLLEQGATELDPDKRKELYRQAEQIIWEEAPWIFLYTQSLILAVNKKLKGLVTFPWEMFSLVKAYKEG